MLQVLICVLRFSIQSIGVWCFVFCTVPCLTVLCCVARTCICVVFVLCVHCICMCKQARCPVDLGGVKADEHGGGTLGKIICLLSLLSTFCPKEIEEKNIT